jgi:hypothetical protein
MRPLLSGWIHSQLFLVLIHMQSSYTYANSFLHKDSISYYNGFIEASVAKYSQLRYHLADFQHPEYFAEFRVCY